MKQIYPDVFHFENVLFEQNKKELYKIYLDNYHLLYTPKLKSGHNMNLKMLCMGKHWSAIDYRYHDNRLEIDKEKIPEISLLLIELAKKFAQESFQDKYNYDYNICILNYYNNGSTLGLHQDNSESRESLKMGHPVVSFSIGASCLFRIAGNTRNSEYNDIILNDGDILIFGGESRLRYHGVRKVYTDTKFIYPELCGGRLNFTLRKY